MRLNEEFAKERLLLYGLLGGVVVFVVSDLFSDSPEQLKGLHLFFELGVALLSIFGIVILYLGARNIKSDLVNTQEQLSVVRGELQDSRARQEELLKESQQWRRESEKFIKGLSESIDRQLERWRLTEAEKQVALLLLKGLGLKEIASIRGVSEKTTRAQATAIYEKSGLAGRSELAAFFLEDLLSPSVAAPQESGPS